MLRKTIVCILGIMTCVALRASVADNELLAAVGRYKGTGGWDMTTTITLNFHH